MVRLLAIAKLPRLRHLRQRLTSPLAPLRVLRIFALSGAGEASGGSTRELGGIGYDDSMTHTLSRLSSSLVLPGALFLIACLACKCGDPSGDSGALSSAPGTASSAVATDEVPGDAEIATRLLKKLHDAACTSETSPHRAWCVADGYATAPAGELPGGETALVGLSIGLSNDFPAAQSLTNNVTLSALGLKRAGSSTMGWISTIRPNAPGEERDTGEAVAGVAALLKGKAASVSLAGPLFGYVRSLPGKTKYPVVRGKKGWVVQSSAVAEVRRVGAYWVAVELPAARPIKGIYLSIFTDKYSSK